MRRMNRSGRLWAKAASFAIAGATLPLGAPADAGELGHFTPALADIRDYLMPAEPWKAAATFKWTHGLGVEDRFEGDNCTLNFAVAF